ncbi:hypothetical protein GGX14DRAFT_397432 [Mycena pura]|uniref:USP domain-containing protein n=1 Tax=Mycena pura TaxID=153505 RepID=A0AAD6VFJ1_9AGAR|nr:hypothetical protein GGX14DRAFT_397432 [Mycena pura]
MSHWWRSLMQSILWNLLFNVSNNKRKTKEQEEPPKPQKLSKPEVDEARFNPASSFALPSWDSVNYSCAYDTMIGVFLVIFDSLPATHVQYLITNSLTAILHKLFATMDRNSVPSFNIVRDVMRNYLSQADVHLPRWGPNLSAFDRIISLLVNVGRVNLYQSESCQNCNKTRSASLRNSSLGSILTDSLWNTYATAYGFSNYGAATLTTQQWANALEYAIFYRSRKTEDIMLDATTACQCPENSTVTKIKYLSGSEPALIFMDIPGEMDDSVLRIESAIFSNLADATYTLCAIVYLGGAHYTSHIRKGAQWYKHDGQQHDGKAVMIGNDTAITSRVEMGRKACGLFYSYSA